MIIIDVEKSGGRFLKHHDASGTWIEVDTKTIHEKVSHALRSARDPTIVRPKKKRVEVYRPPSAEEDEMFKNLYSSQQITYTSLLDTHQEEEDTYLFAAHTMMMSRARSDGDIPLFLPPEFHHSPPASPGRNCEEEESDDYGDDDCNTKYEKSHSF